MIEKSYQNVFVKHLIVRKNPLNEVVAVVVVVAEVAPSVGDKMFVVVVAEFYDIVGHKI